MHPDVLVVHGIIVDAAVGRRNPRSHFALFMYAMHQAHDESTVALAGQPFGKLGVELFLADRLSGQIGRNTRPASDIAPAPPS